MQIIRGLKGLREAVTALKGKGRVALVPTMGALHEGHLALIAEGKARADKVIATIFVNPLQFNDKGDLERYPRTEEEDAAKLEAAGCDLLWMPSVDDFYPEGFATTVVVDGLTELWEGAHRPGHFDGVTTVVAKLFTGTMPDVAIFGEKDFQQLAIIRRMTVDLGLPIEIIGLPTVRAEDGLALSSRNALLSDDERRRARGLHDALSAAKRAIEAGGDVGPALDETRAKLEICGFGKVDYVALVDAKSLQPMENAAGEMRLIAAVFLGKVRLIDNIRVVSDTV